MPPLSAIHRAILESGFSVCRSRRGAAIFEGDQVIATGHNRKPEGFHCDGSLTCKATCGREAIHAEQDAILKVGLHRVMGCEMLHVKTVDGELVTSGPPSCVECSKLIVFANLSAMWLFHADGWRRYEAAEFHRLSMAYKPSAVRP